MSLTFKKCLISHSYLGIVHLIFALNVKMHEIDDAKSSHVILLIKSHLQMTPGPGKFTLRFLLHQYIHKFILAFDLRIGIHLRIGIFFNLQSQQ